MFVLVSLEDYITIQPNYFLKEEEAIRLQIKEKYINKVKIFIIL